MNQHTTTTGNGTAANSIATDSTAASDTAVTDTRHTLGAQGEALAADYLERIGCEVLDRNWRFGRAGELDLVVNDHGTLAAVEVKTRSGTGYGSPFEAITPLKARRLRRLLLAWVRAHQPGAAALRVDAIGLILRPGEEPHVEHLKGIS